MEQLLGVGVFYLFIHIILPYKREGRARGMPQGRLKHGYCRKNLAITNAELGIMYAAKPRFSKANKCNYI